MSGAESLRIILLSHDASEFALLHRACVDVGTVPVAYVSARSRRPRGCVDPSSATVIADLLSSLPDATDLLLPATASSLVEMLAGYASDLLVSYCFPWKLPKSVLGLPRLGVINVHSSLLPRFRGPIPVHWAIRNGDKEIGVTAHWMDEEFDRGPIIAQRAGIPVGEDATADHLFGSIGAAIPGLLSEALVLAAEGCPGVPQEESIASYAGWMEPEFGAITWAHRAGTIHNQVRTFRFATGGARGPVATVAGEHVEILETRTEPADGVRVECADGPIWIVRSQPWSYGRDREPFPWIAQPPNHDQT